METSREKRAARRYSIAYEVAWENGNGVTRDLSTCGIRFVTDGNHQFRIGKLVRFFIVVRRLENSINGLHCEGSVIRIDRNSSGWDVAVCLQSFRFECASGVA